MSVVRLRFAACLVLLSLTACGDDAATQAEQGGSASGEILPASLSDDMIATDSLRSQAPQMAEQPTAAASGAADPAAPEGEEAAVEGEPAAAPEPEAAAAE
jgi:hypothetical protein